MSKHRKSPGKPQELKPEDVQSLDTNPPVTSPTIIRTKQPAATSRIEARGLDLELVSTPAPVKPKRPTLAVGVIDITPAAKAHADAEAKRLESERLRDELKQIAVGLDLPSRRRPRPKTLSEAVAYAKPRDFKHLTQMLAPVIVVIGVMTAAATLHTPPPPELPPALLGGWVTYNPDYQGRELGFVDAELVIRLAPDAGLERYPITAVSQKSSGDTTTLALTYTTDGGPVELHAKLVGGQNPTLVFDRPHGLVWERRTN